MLPSNTILGVCLISQLCVGVTGNSLLFILYIYTFFFKPQFKKLIDSICMHLTIVNVLMIIFMLISHIMSSIGVHKFLDDAGCRGVLFISRVSRGMSISTTSILSTFQVITITPSNSRWAWLKPKLSKLTLSSLLCSWLINLLIYAYMVPLVIAKTNSTHFGNGYLDPYCQNKHFGDQNSGSFLIVIFIYDFFYVAIMMWTSLYMVIVLYRHRKRVQHLHSTSLSSQPSPERRATHYILLLVICFVFIYWLNNFITLSGVFVQVKIPNLEGFNAILATCYPTICPFLLMKNNKLVLQFTSFSERRMACFQSALRG
ncbi:vomeronasal type-1 receptor 4-like isoform X1 [Cricetulus griseus]|uniref:vomeronasal type-1 receptor 4-like isoform X1 n=1 Tax=Cricetulus griseus TaxID=10029 RepID=UPI00022F7148|nr:vomeronasal type-1 receptor 4-like isoform X1 [Cricetulus griseus]